MFTKEEAQALRHAFWHKLESKSRRIPGQNGKPIKWMMDKTGVKGLDLRFDVTNGRAMVALEINSHSTDKNNALWNKLTMCKSLIEAHFDNNLVWDPEFVREAGNIVHRIYISQPGDIYAKDQWADMIHFMIDGMLRMESAYREIQDYMTN